MTAAELDQALVAVCAAVVAVAFAVVVLIPREPLAPGLLGDDPSVVPLDEGARAVLSTLPIWRPPITAGPDDVVAEVVDLSPAELDRLDALLADLEQQRPDRRFPF